MAGRGAGSRRKRDIARPFVEKGLVSGLIYMVGEAIARGLLFDGTRYASPYLPSSPSLPFFPVPLLPHYGGRSSSRRPASAMPRATPAFLPLPQPQPRAITHCALYPSRFAAQAHEV